MTTWPIFHRRCLLASVYFVLENAQTSQDFYSSVVTNTGALRQEGQQQMTHKQAQSTAKSARKRRRSEVMDTTQPSDSAPPPTTGMPVIASDREAGQQAGWPIPEATPKDIDPDLRHRMIREAAYKLYVERGYRNGHGLDDWRQAEAEVDRVLASQRMGGLLKPDANVRASGLTEFHNEIMAAGYSPEEFTADVLSDGNGADGNSSYAVRVIRSVPGHGGYGIMFREDAERKWKVDFYLALHTQQFGRPMSMQQGAGPLSTEAPSLASPSDKRRGLAQEVGLVPPGNQLEAAD